MNTLNRHICSLVWTTVLCLVGPTQWTCRKLLNLTRADPLFPGVLGDELTSYVDVFPRWMPAFILFELFACEIEPLSCPAS